MPSPDRSRRELRNRAKLALWLALPFIGLMLLVSPRGDFPLNDDWVYAKMVQALANDGHFGLSPFSNAYALTQTLYAAPLVKLFGFSFTLLRLTTIFMGWVTVCFTAFTARELGLPNRSAMLAALTVFVNPLFINLSYTFMTDVPFCAFASISMYYFVRALRTPANANLLLGTLFSVLAFYDRQLGILIPIAALLASFATMPRQVLQSFTIRTVTLVTAPWAMALAAALLLPESSFHIEVTSPLPQLAQRASNVAIAAVPVCTLLAGMSLLPLSVYIAIYAWRAPCKDLGWKIVALPIIALGAFFLCGLAARYIEYGPPQIIHTPMTLRIGPALFVSMYGADRLGIKSDFPLPFWAGLLLLAAYGISIAIAAFIIALRMTLRPKRLLAARVCTDRFLLLLAVAMTGIPAIAGPGPFYDRYVLIALPPTIILVTRHINFSMRGPATAALGFILATMITHSVLGLQDYMAWNTARWSAIDILREKYGAADTEIDGGYEFNGMHTSVAHLRNVSEQTGDPKKPWWIVGDTYRVTPVAKTETESNYVVIETVPYFSWLGFETRYIYAMRTNPKP